WNGGSRITERIGAIAHRLVFKSKILVLHMHVVDAERLAAVVDRTAPGAVGIGQRITLRQEVALLIHRAERLIADFVVDQHEFTEVRPRTILNDGLPSAPLRGGITGSQWLEIFR